MPKIKAKDALAGIAGEIADLEEKRERAAAQIREAENELSAIDERRSEIALAVVSEEAAAVTEDAELEERAVREAGRLKVARAAVAKAEEMISDARARLMEEERRGHQERYEELARERYALDTELEEVMSILLEKLSSLEDLDRSQRNAGYSAGIGERFQTTLLSSVLENWLAARLGGASGPLPLSTMAYYQEHSLAEVDGLAAFKAEA